VAHDDKECSVVVELAETQVGSSRSAAGVGEFAMLPEFELFGFSMVWWHHLQSRSSGMKRQIVIWAIAGFLVASLWALYAAATFPHPSISAQPIVWALINMSRPVMFASFHSHFGIKLYWVLLANAAMYGLFGLAVESLRQQLNHAK
jgi:hypothetical protein